jgi:hypothetical protein
MYLPNKEKAIIREEKLTEYLLSKGHPEGRHKAVFFQLQGYTQSNQHLLSDALKKHILHNEVVSEIRTNFGIKYAVDGVLETLINKYALVRSVWFIKDGGEIPELVTVYPIK